MSRAFDKQAYQELDAIGKQVVCDYLCSLGRAIKIPPENHGPDLIEYDQYGNIVLYHEIECRRQWEGGAWPWEDISVPIRKRKLVSKYGHKLYLWTVSSTLEEAYYIRADVIVDAFLGPRIVHGREEWFYLTPPALWSHVCLIDGG